MSLVVYNTLTRTTEPFETLEPGRSACTSAGQPSTPTRTSATPCRPSCSTSSAATWQYKGYDVRHVMNFTDVDDKIIARAAKSGEDPAVIASRYAEKYQEQLEQLNVLAADRLPACLADDPGDHPDVIQGLIEKGMPMSTPGGDVYFRVRSDPGLRQALATAAGGGGFRHAGDGQRRKSETKATSPCGRRPSRASRAGTARGARAGRAGTSNARP